MKRKIIRKRTSRKDHNKAFQRYKLFHGRRVQSVSYVNFPKNVTELIHLGRADFIGYTSAKKLSGKFRLNKYKHGFGKDVHLMCTKDGKFLVIGGGNFKVGKWLYK